MKTIKTILALAVLTACAGLQSVAQAQQSGCGNNNPSSPTAPPPGCPSQGVNPINVLSGDVQRTVRDLEVWGGVGQHQLAWERLGHSRLNSAPKWFGDGHIWRHSYQWDMAVSGSTLTLYYPEGTVYNYTASGTNWLGVASNPDTIAQSGTNYVLLRANGWRYSFNKYTSPSVFYRLDKFFDAQGNAYKLTYDSSNRLSRVTEPAGRWLQVNYQTLPVDSENFTTLASYTGTAPAGQWTTLTVANTNTFRYVRYYTGGDGTPEDYCNLAEVQFYGTATNLLTGTVFGTDPAYNNNTNNRYLMVFDGNTNTFFDYAYPHFGFAGLDLGTPHRVTSVHFFPRPRLEYRANGSLFQGANVAAATETVIASVQTSDGRSVTYNYGTTNDPVLGSDWVTMNSVSYGDGTQATYSYTQLWPGQRPLMTSAVDPRVAGNATQMRYQYWTNSLYYGGIYMEQSYATTNMMVKLTGTGVWYCTNSIVTYANGAVRSITDNGYGYIGQSTDGLGRTTSYTYDASNQGFMLSSTDPLGHTTSYTRDSQGRPLTITAPDGGVTSYTYDSIGQPLTITDPLNHTTTYTRDAQHRVTGVAYPDSTTEAYTYNAFSQPLTHTLRNGGVERFGYATNNGLLLAATNALGSVTHYTYYASSLPATVTDANGHTTTTTYTERGLPLQVVNADASVKTYGYDAFGNQTAVTNELGAAWTTLYDEYRRVTAKIDPLNRTTLISYNLPGSAGCSCASSQNKPTSITQPGGEVTHLTYDLEWQLLNQTAGYGTTDAATTQYQYDAAGRVIATIDPNGQNWTYGYDVNDRPTSATDPLGNTTGWAYDVAGNKLTETRADNGVTTSSYDVMHRIISTTDPLNRTTQMGYDASGNLTALTDANNNVTHWSYDLLNRQTAKTYADSTQDKYGFDAVGNPVGVTNAAGQVASHTYDVRNRLVQSTWNDGVTPTVTRSYDLAGRLVSLNNGNAADTYAYDPANQLLAESNSVAGNIFITSYGYDADGRKQTLVYPSGNTLTNTFTARSQVKAIYANGPPPIATFSYDVNGNRLSLALGNGVTNGYVYDNASRLTGLTAKIGSGTIATFGYTYNVINNRTALVREDGRTENYGYDAAEQLTGVTYGDTTGEGFNYDAMGNLSTRQNVAGGTDNFSVNNLNQYTAVNGNATSYDSKGNLLTAVMPTASSLAPNASFGYDAQNRLVGATRGTNGAIFVYDGRNRCVQRTINGTTTTYIYDGWDLIAEYSGNTPIAEYIHGPGTDEMLARATAIGTVYYTGDALNSVAALTDGSGNVVERYRYTAFGQPTILNPQSSILASSAYGNRFAFQGREWFAELNLTDHRNRYYSPELNRWLNRDPAEDVNLFGCLDDENIPGENDDINPYVFVENAPVLLVDTFGLEDSIPGFPGITGGPSKNPPPSFLPPGLNNLMPPWGPVNIPPKSPPTITCKLGGGWNGGVSGNPIKGSGSGTISGPILGGTITITGGYNGGKGGGRLNGGINWPWPGKHS
jgi:RHS repeat-associated protein